MSSKDSKKEEESYKLSKTHLCAEYNSTSATERTVCFKMNNNVSHPIVLAEARAMALI